METTRQCLIGIASNNFVMLAADQTNTLNSVVIKDEDDVKIYEISDHLMVALSGEAGGTSQFVQFIKHHFALYSLKNGYSLDTAPAVNYIRKTYADTLSKSIVNWNGIQNSPLINMLVAGYDAADGCQLYFIDYLATCIKMPYFSTGLGGLFSMGVLDRYYKYNMSELEAYEVLKLCFKEIQRRLIYNLPRFYVKVICRTGTHELPPITFTD